MLLEDKRCNLLLSTGAKIRDGTLENFSSTVISTEPKGRTWENKELLAVEDQNQPRNLNARKPMRCIRSP